ncbi:MAG TPA: 2-hydroxyacyl-CoA dehydratase [bacterium]|nr:2-hydroxyacyl-CoA dehydratase [bacterium]HMW33788.1 2-hydroxyacyl-CoA dehydratase [bacterium]HMW36413.1 2-hydroxyacyl-CoA dehydratase [bacterium]HMZ05616.1 2-hydroxyacyl-CoA dehydratase [bacterium]HNB09071.1 2-hydroxyacyl-CoA dehydratase [bacterium]
MIHVPLEGKTLEETLYNCRELAEDPSFPTVKAWRENGGKVLGHFQVYFPEELAYAAGMLPFKVCGAQVEGMEAESHFGSYLCSVIKTSLELALTKQITLDMFVTHPICDAARNLAAIWGRNFSYPCQILYLPQNPNSRHSAEYLRGEYHRLLTDIETIVGHKVRDEDIANAIGVYNESRRLMRELYDIKRETPWLIAAEDAYALIAIAGCLPRDAYNALMQRVLPQIRERRLQPKDKMRIVFEGGFCEQPPLDLIQVIGQSCYIVDDDLLIGLRYILEDVPSTGDPLANLAESYIERSSYSPVQHDLRKPKEEMLLERIRHSRAEAAIITAAKMCEPGLEEQVAYTKALDQAGVPYFVSEFEENQTTFDHIGIQLETFVENLIFQ